MIKLAEVSYKHAETYSIRNISVVFEKGRFYTILGASGSGKSTLAAILARIVKPTEGRYDFKYVKKNKYGKNTSTSQISLLRTKLNHFENHTVVENIEIQNAFSGTKQTKRQILAMLAEIGIDEKMAAKKVITLRQNMRIRLAIIKLFVKPTPVIIIDSPLASLDDQFAQELLENKIALLDKRQHCLIYFSEDNDIIKRSDEVYGMNRGRLLFVRYTI